MCLAKYFGVGSETLYYCLARVCCERTLGLRAQRRGEGGGEREGEREYNTTRRKLWETPTKTLRT